jgi:phosphate/sulfate permease
MSKNNEIKPEYPSLDVVFQEVNARLEMQFRAKSALDTKASIIFGFCGVILASSLWSSQNNGQTLYIWLTMSPLLFVFFAAIFSLIAYCVVAYRRDPEPRPLVENYLGRMSNETEKQILDNWVVSFEENECKIKRKVKFVKLSFLFLTFGIILFVVGHCAILLKITQ